MVLVVVLVALYIKIGPATSVTGEWKYQYLSSEHYNLFCLFVCFGEQSTVKTSSGYYVDCNCKKKKVLLQVSMFWGLYTIIYTYQCASVNHNSAYHILVKWQMNHGINLCCRQLLLCRVTLGKSFLQFSAMKMAHAPPGHHSVTGRPSQGGLNYTEYVIYRGEQVCDRLFSSPQNACPP